MTYDQYSAQVAEKLSKAYNNKNRPEAERIFSEADAALRQSGATRDALANFWSNVHQRFSSSRLLIEKQENSALHALMKLINDSLEARQALK